MKRVAALAVLAALAGLSSVSVVEAKDCPSRISSNLHPIGSSPFSWGLELRGFSYSVDSENYLFPGSAAMLRFEPSDAFSVEIEGLYRDKTYVDCDKAGDVSAFQLKTLTLVFNPGKALGFRLGRQEIRVGNGLVLDDFFDAVVIDLSVGGFDLTGGAGTLALGAARETGTCQKGFFFEYKSCWKGTCGASYGDFNLAFAAVSRRLGEGFRLGILYERIFSAESVYDADIVSLFGQVRLPLGFRLFAEAAIQRFAASEDTAFGGHLQSLRSWRFSGVGTVQVKLHALYGSGGEQTYFLPTFGTMTLAERMHYSVRQGLSLGAEMIFTPEFFKILTLRAGYFGNSGYGFEAPTTQEIDLGVGLKPFKSDLLRLDIVYSAARTLSGPVNQFKMEARMTF
ncbi:MAG: hypothetical protein JW843_13165 [Candidatus Aminicenantes bacterium]|nr:hypothetical protein [Candidatus Aminicenantes bacterium]